MHWEWATAVGTRSLNLSRPSKNNSTFNQPHQHPFSRTQNPLDSAECLSPETGGPGKSDPGYRSPVSHID